MALAHTLARLTDAIGSAKPAQRLTVAFGTVTAVSTGTGVDGTDVVTVTIGADDVDAPRLSEYGSPAVDDAVMVLFVDSSPVILGPLTGIPVPE